MPDLVDDRRNSFNVKMKFIWCELPIFMNVRFALTSTFCLSRLTMHPSQ